MKSFKRVVALVSLTSFLAAPAFAGPGNGNGHGHAQHTPYGYNWNYASWRVRSMTFGLQSVEVKRDRDELKVRYKVDPQSLRMANNAGIFPVMTVQAGFQTFTARLDRKEGVVSFPLERRNDPREAQISVSGANGRYRIDYVAIGGAVSQRLAVPVSFERDRDRDHGHDRDRDGHHGGGYPQQPSWSFTPAVIQACGNAFDGRYNEQQCLRTVDGFSFNPVGTIDACEQTMDGDANELACLQTAARSAVPRIPALNACEIAMDGDANELACFAKATTARFEAKSTIDACEIAFDGDANELACMDAAFRYTFNPVPVIQSCEMSMDGDASELACLARY